MGEATKIEVGAGLSEENEPKTTRRDFLKLSGLGAFVTLAARAFENPTPVNSTITPEDINHFGIIETDKAFFYPIFENHSKQPDVPSEMKTWPTQPAIHFYEFELREPALDFQKNWTPGGMLLSNIGSLNPAEQAAYGRRIPNDTLRFFSDRDISVSFEGAFLPTSLNISSQTFETIEPLTALGVDAAVATIELFNHDVHGENFGKNMAHTLLKAGAVLQSIWALTPTPITDVALHLEAGTSKDSLRSVKDALWNVNKLVRGLHPEYTAVFFRNLVIARKLQTLGKYAGSGSNEKPAISFQAGFDHMGIKDLLKQDDDAVLAGFNIYPTSVLKEVVDTNGGIDAFCTTVVVSPKDVFVYGEQKKEFVLDQQLKDYLEKRLA